jgi:hypothetical protein
MTTPVARVLVELADRESIRECLCRYTRGVDRLDADMVRSACWPDVVHQHLATKRNTEEFIAWSFPIMARMDQTQHYIQNVLVTLRGETADVESYYLGFHRVNEPGGKHDVMVGGRYIDRFEKRAGEWRIADRWIVTDWFRRYTDSSDWSNGMLGLGIQPGARYPEDDSYRRIRIE